MKKAIAIAAAIVGWTLLTAGSCATTSGPPATVQRVEIPVPVLCARPAPAKPDLVDNGPALKGEPDIFAKTRLLLAGRAQRDAYIAELEASRAGCD